MEKIHRGNPVLKALQQLTHEEIGQLTRKQVIGKLGLNKLLTPQERVLCQQQVAHLQNRYAELSQLELQRLRLSQEAEKQSRHKKILNLVEKQMTTTDGKKMPNETQREVPTITNMKIQASFEPLPAANQQIQITPVRQTPTKNASQQPSFIKNEPPLETTSKDMPKQEQWSFKPSEPYPFVSLRNHFVSQHKTPYACHQMQQDSQELLQCDDEEMRLLIRENQTETRKQDIYKIDRKKKR